MNTKTQPVASTTLPSSYTGGTLVTDISGGASAHLHFSSEEEAEQWFNAITDPQPVASEPSSGEWAQLREFALAWRGYKLNNMSSTAEHIGMLFVHKRNFQNATTPDAIISILDKLDAAEAALLWYKHRVDMMQTWQSKMRDPERTIVCDIIANGQTLPDPKGERYGLSSDAKPASEQENLLCVEVAGLSSANGHLSDLVDDLRQIVSDAMASMKEIEDVAKPQDESHGDFDCVIPYESWSKFVDARASLLYRIEHSPHELPPASEPVAVPQGYPCEIEEADFEANTITVKMLTNDYRIHAGEYRLSAAPSPAPVGINGLTEAETNASASVIGLTKPAEQTQDREAGT